MSDPFEYLNRLASLARLETAPRVDVSRRVLFSLQETPAALEMPLGWFAAGSLAMAAVFLILSLELFQVLNDPLGGLFWLLIELI